VYYFYSQIGVIMVSSFLKTGQHTNEQITEEIETDPMLEYTGKQRENWRRHVNRMDRIWIPKQILQYAP
jgi:hypothetical protein